MTNKEMFMRRLASAGISKFNHQRRTAMMNKKSSLFLLIMLMSAAIYTQPASALEAYPSANLGEITILRYHRSDWVNIPAGGYNTLTWNCGKFATGGGFETRNVPNDNANFRVFKSYPSSNGGWQIRLQNQENIARDVRIWVVCAE